MFSNDDEIVLQLTVHDAWGLSTGVLEYQIWRGRSFSGSSLDVGIDLVIRHECQSLTEIAAAGKSSFDLSFLSLARFARDR